jgi:hypothetical protein
MEALTSVWISFWGAGQEVGEAVDIRSFFTLPFVMTVLGISVFLILVPVIKLLRRTGHHPLWSLFAIFPGLNLFALWHFAFKPWPTDKAHS